jgi:CRISPR-associated endonuclease/helicase Cas3
LVYEANPDPKAKDRAFEKARWKTLEILRKLRHCDWVDDERYEASPLALADLNLSDEERSTAFTPQPMVLPASDILFDSWSFTTIRGSLPGRPHVEPYLHGVAEWEPPETHVAWRDEVEIVQDELLDRYSPKDLLEDYPLKPHELMRDQSDRVFRQITKIAERQTDAPVWLLDEDGTVEPTTLSALTDKDQIYNRTVLLPPSAGGLDKGFLNADSDKANDVADEWLQGDGKRRRMRVWDDEAVPPGMRLIRAIDVHPSAEEAEDGSATTRRYWRWYELPRSADSDGSKAAASAVEWRVHTDDVVRNVEVIADRLLLSEELRNAVVLAAKFHDLGKQRTVFQRILGNMRTDIVLAKSGRKGQTLGLPETYRHEFGSLLDVEAETELAELNAEMKDLVLHLIATHHGRARPHFPTDEAFDPEPNGKDVSAIASEVPRRFARLQRRYGRWGLAYLESLLRAGDYAASANPSAFVEEDN